MSSCLHSPPWQGLLLSCTSFRLKFSCPSYKPPSGQSTRDNFHNSFLFPDRMDGRLQAVRSAAQRPVPDRHGSLCDFSDFLINTPAHQKSPRQWTGHFLPVLTLRRKCPKIEWIQYTERFSRTAFRKTGKSICPAAQGTCSREGRLFTSRPSRTFPVMPSHFICRNHSNRIGGWSL